MTVVYVSVMVLSLNLNAFTMNIDFVSELILAPRVFRTACVEGTICKLYAEKHNGTLYGVRRNGGRLLLEVFRV